MKVFSAKSTDELGKLRAIVDAFPQAWHGEILDVGCRTGHLRLVLPRETSYLGVDISAPADVRVDLERGLPFDRGTFDTVVALDVLEHTDNLHAAFGELCRCARGSVVISLPNIYEVRTRWRFLLGRTPSGKYGLPVEYSRDRHRWLFTLTDARVAVHALAEQHAFSVCTDGCLVGPRRSGRFGHRLAAWFPGLLSQFYIALLHSHSTVSS